MQFAYVANYGSNNVSAYSIAAGGALTPVAGSPFKAGGGANGVAIDPTGKFAYVANFDSNDVSAYTIDSTSGALKKVKGSPFAAGATPECDGRCCGQVRLCCQLRLQQYFRLYDRHDERRTDAGERIAIWGGRRSGSGSNRSFRQVCVCRKR